MFRKYRNFWLWSQATLIDIFVVDTFAFFFRCFMIHAGNPTLSQFQ